MNPNQNKVEAFSAYSAGFSERYIRSATRVMHYLMINSYWWLFSVAWSTSQWALHQIVHNTHKQRDRLCTRYTQRRRATTSRQSKNGLNKVRNELQLQNLCLLEEGLAPPAFSGMDGSAAVWMLMWPSLIQPMGSIRLLLLTSPGVNIF